MSFHTKKIGRLGEQQAKEYLIAQGFFLVHQNFKVQWAEVDLIVEKNDQLRFVEVKTWGSYSADSLEYALNENKKQRIYYAAEAFLEKFPQWSEYEYHFDLIYIPLKRQIDKAPIEWIKDIFS